MKTQLVKKIKSIFTVLMAVTLFACVTNGDLNNNEITGVYIGSLTLENSSNLSASNPSISAVADIIKDENQIELHFYGEGFDTSIILDYYPNGDEVMICLTGTDFEEMYGHTLGHGNMSQHNNQWMEHLNNEHEEGDEHFGYFDLLQQSLHCTFQIGDENYRFQGIKNQ